MTTKKYRYVACNGLSVKTENGYNFYTIDIPHKDWFFTKTEAEKDYQTVFRFIKTSPYDITLVAYKNGEDYELSENGNLLIKTKGKPECYYTEAEFIAAGGKMYETIEDDSGFFSTGKEIDLTWSEIFRHEPYQGTIYIDDESYYIDTISQEN